MNGLIVATVAIGLLVDQYGGTPGRVAVNVCAWALLARLWLDTLPGQRIALLACLLYATAGEVFLSLVWGLYDYRLGDIPLFVPPGHVLLFCLGSRLAARLPDAAPAWIAALALPVVAAFAWTGRDTLGPYLYALFVICLLASSSRKLYATMLLLALAMELWGTWLGNWTWRREVAWLGAVTVNPPLAAGALYAALDLLVVSTVGFLDRQAPASPRRTPSTVSHQAATCSARSSSR